MALLADQLSTPELFLFCFYQNSLAECILENISNLNSLTFKSQGDMFSLAFMKNILYC